MADCLAPPSMSGIVSHVLFVLVTLVAVARLTGFAPLLVRTWLPPLPSRPPLSRAGLHHRCGSPALIGAEWRASWCLSLVVRAYVMGLNCCLLGIHSFTLMCAHPQETVAAGVPWQRVLPS